MEKDLSFCELNQIYGKLLTDKQREITDLYYSCDLSLAEIAEMKNISRSACLDNITNAKKHLLRFEKELKLARKRKDLNEALAKDLSVGDLKKRINEIMGE